MASCDCRRLNEVAHQPFCCFASIPVTAPTCRAVRSVETSICSALGEKRPDDARHLIGECDGYDLVRVKPDLRPPPSVAIGLDADRGREPLCNHSLHA